MVWADRVASVVEGYHGEREDGVIFVPCVELDTRVRSSMLPRAVMYFVNSNSVCLQSNYLLLRTVSGYSASMCCMRRIWMGPAPDQSPR